MRYRIASSEPRGLTLVLSMPERVLIIVILVVAAAIGLLIALAFVVSAETQDDRFRALVSAGVGLFCLSGLLLFVRGFAPPGKIELDNTAARAVVFDRKGRAEAEIPYSGLKGFSVCPVLSERILGYSVGIELERGGRWELYVSRSRERAQAFLDELSRGATLAAARAPTTAGPAVDATADPAALVPRPDSPLHREHPSADTLEYRWERKTPVRDLVTSMMVVMSFAAILVGSLPFASGLASRIVMVALAVLLVGFSVVTIARTARERKTVRIGRISIEYQRQSPLSRPSSFSIPRSQVAMVDFSLRLARVATSITFLRAGEVETFVRARQGTFAPSDTLSLVRFLGKLPRIDVSSLPMKERMELAEALRAAVGPGGG